MLAVSPGVLVSLLWGEGLMQLVWEGTWVTSCVLPCGLLQNHLLLSKDDSLFCGLFFDIDSWTLVRIILIGSPSSCRQVQLWWRKCSSNLTGLDCASATIHSLATRASLSPEISRDIHESRHHWSWSNCFFTDEPHQLPPEWFSRRLCSSPFFPPLILPSIPSALDEINFCTSIDCR